MPTILFKTRETRFFLYLIAAVILSFAAKGLTTGTAVYGWILGITIAVSLLDAAAPMAKSAAKTALVALLRIALPLVAKHINPEEVVASVGTAQGISVSALNAAVGSKGIFGLRALQAILAGAETDAKSLRSMLRGAALVAISNGYEFTAIAEAEQAAATAEALKLAAAERKSAAQQLYETQVANLGQQLRVKLASEDGVIGEQEEIIEGLNPLLTAAPEAGITESTRIN